MNKYKIMTLTKKDFRIEFFRAGGKGGQKQNKTSSACRITHIQSSAVGESREERSQIQNKKIAFNKLCETKKFKNWLRVEAAARLQGFENIDKKIEEMMKPENLKVEFLNDNKEK